MGAGARRRTLHNHNKETAVYRLISRITCLSALILLASYALAQAEFSADIVDLQRQGTPMTQAKVYFAKDKMRIESQGQNPRGMGAVLMNFATSTSTVLMPQQHMYMEMPTGTVPQRGLYSFFQTGDVDNACDDWKKMQRNQNGTCRKVGNETVNGRNTVKYEGTSNSGDVNYVWLDPKLRFPVKWQGKNSGGELRNIQEGGQPGSLFEIPAGYTKMDLGGMMQQRQQH
jgi:hypothetical protein